MSPKQLFIIFALFCASIDFSMGQWWLGMNNNHTTVGQAPAHNNGGLFGNFHNPFAPTTTKTTTTTAAPQPAPAEEVASRQGAGHHQGNKHQKNPYETHQPCLGDDVTMTRPSGEVTPETNYWRGTVDLSDFPYLQSIKLVIKVDNPAKIEVSRNEGKVSGPSMGTIFRVTYFGAPPEVQTVNFKITGTSGKLFPNLIQLHLNNRDICKGAVAWVNNVVDSLEGAGLGPAAQYIQNVENFWGELIEKNSGQTAATRPPQKNTKKPTTKATQPPVSGCGRRLNQREAYITSGYETRPGDWPWHTALYHVNQRTVSYVCGGTLINDHTVLTAAHCLHSTGRAITPDRVRVHLGKHQLNVIDPNTQEFLISQVIIHPEYSSIDLQDDIGLLKLANRVTFTNFIQPACLWSANQKALDTVIGKKGHVVGWGLTEEDGLAEVLHEGTMPVVSFLECLESNRDFFGPVLSDFNYCAGYRNGTSVCNGDSGGGMFFENNGSWQIRGLVSFSSVREDRDVCNPENYVIFTDAAKYLDWVNANL